MIVQGNLVTQKINSTLIHLQSPRALLWFFLLLLFSPSTPSLAHHQEINSKKHACQIIESNTLEDVRKYIEPGTLFVFDFDDVLIEGKDNYGFGDWFYAMLTALQQEGLSKQDALNKLIPVYINIQSTAEVKLVEDGAKKLIDDLKNAGHPVMILTTRGSDMIDITFRQLRSTGIDIEHNAIPENNITRKPGSRSQYIHGIYFCSRSPKGPILKSFLQSNPDLDIKQVIFINDKRKYLEDVQISLTDLGISFVGIRYGRTDARSKAYIFDEESTLLVQKILSNQ